MQVYNSFSEITPDKNRFITVGSFDGVHRGHAYIIKTLTDAARARSAKSLVITFEPHPQLVVGGSYGDNFKLLTLRSEKIRLLNAFNIDELMIIPFTKEFSKTSAEEFLCDYLAGRIGFSCILAGYDNYFGRNRSGNSSLLKKFAPILKYDLAETGIFRFDNMIISSSLIRRLIRNGSIEEANRLLGYQYFLGGTIVEGNKLGRTLGFPTINIKPEDSNKLMPDNGVYLTKVELEGKSFFGMANIGTRPTLTNDKTPTLEINLFDFSENAYGKATKVEFLRFIRPEIKFPNAESLIAQMQSDKKKCSEIIN